MMFSHHALGGSWHHCTSAFSLILMYLQVAKQNFFSKSLRCGLSDCQYPPRCVWPTVTCSLCLWQSVLIWVYHSESHFGMYVYNYIYLRVKTEDKCSDLWNKSFRWTEEMSYEREYGMLCCFIKAFILKAVCLDVERWDLNSHSGYHGDQQPVCCSQWDSSESLREF